MVQHGILAWFFDTIPDKGIEMLGLSNEISKSLLISGHVVENSADVIPLGWRHFYPVLYLLITGLIIGIIVLTFELLYDRHEKGSRKVLRGKVFIIIRQRNLQQVQ